jgi:hypothetical protein
MPDARHEIAMVEEGVLGPGTLAPSGQPALLGQHETLGMNGAQVKSGSAWLSLFRIWDPICDIHPMLAEPPTGGWPRRRLALTSGPGAAAWSDIHHTVAEPPTGGWPHRRLALTSEP